MTMRRLSASFIVITGVSCGAALAGEIQVPVGQPTIQAGINAAVNGDTVIVAAGTYNEAISFLGKAITVQASGGADVTTISASGLGTSAVTIPDTGGAGQAVLDGFTVTGGVGTGTSVSRSGGGVSVSGDASLLNCRITGNTAFGSGSGSGGGVRKNGGSLVMRNCLVSANSASGGCAGATGGGFAGGGNVLFVHCTFTNNSAGAACAGTTGGRGGGLSLSSGSPTLVGCVIDHNSVSGGGGSAVGGGIDSTHAATTLINCRVTANNCFNLGGAGSTTSGIGSTGSPAMILQACTVANNTHSGGPPFGAGGVYNFSPATPISISNSIIYGNSGLEISATGATVQNSCIEAGYAGTGNISSDPLFVDPANGNFHLQNASPCRDIGNRTLLPTDSQDLDGDANMAETLSRDLDLVRRIVNGQVDMGAFEWQRTCLPDVSPSRPGVAGNGLIDIDDLLGVINGWGSCDQCVADIDDDGDVDLDDLLAVITAWGTCP